MSSRVKTGKFVPITILGGSYQAFIPNLLPPNPTIHIPKLGPMLDKAHTALGRLDGISKALPDPSLLLYTLMKKETLASDQTKPTLTKYETEEISFDPQQNVLTVSAYITTLQYGLKHLEKGKELNDALLFKMHRLLLSHALDNKKSLGHYRKIPSWIGSAHPDKAVTIPSAPEYILKLMHNLFDFIHNKNDKISPLLKAAIAHVQFESIHPFEQGNGRLGRLLISLILCANDLCTSPLLYLGLYFNQQRIRYFENIQLVRDTGYWENWIAFFLEGIIETSNHMVEIIELLLQHYQHDLNKIITNKRSTTASFTVFEFLKISPVITIKAITDECSLSCHAATKAIHHLQSLGILKQISGPTKNKLYAYQAFLRLR